VIREGISELGVCDALILLQLLRTNADKPIKSKPDEKRET